MNSDLELFPTDLQSLLQIFASLSDVRFPDVDAAGLDAAVKRVKERHLEVAAAEAALAAARAALDDEQEALLRKGHRLHAYLKVFSEADEALAAKVNALTLPRLRRSAPTARPADAETQAEPPKKRGRPRRTPPSDALFAEPTMLAAAATT